MKFEKPLKVFLSYSHADAPALFREFRNQLKSLEDDGVLRIWADTDIAAGRNWDREIKKSLDECQIFLALTSASFNASGYICGVEMDRAWQRHAAGECRIVPVMWRQWRPPERLRALQFLLGIEQDAVNAANRDDVLYRLTVKLEQAVNEMTQGWAPQSRTSEPLPSDLPYLCDWTGPILRLRSLRFPEGSARRPGVLILIGAPDDCADRFIERTTREELPRALDIEGLPVHDVRLMEWPPDPSAASAFLHYALDNAEPGWGIEKKLREGLTLVRTATAGWNADKAAVLARLLTEWRGTEWLLPVTRRLLLVVSILNTRRDRTLAQIEKIVQAQEGIRGAVVTLPEIERDDAVNWTSLPQVRRRCRPDRIDSLTGDIVQVYRRERARALPMKPLASELLRLLEQYREGGAIG